MTDQTSHNRRVQAEVEQHPASRGSKLWTVSGDLLEASRVLVVVGAAIEGRNARYRRDGAADWASETITAESDHPS